ncbi:hypothetical protein TNCV_4842831 [Trichonephila clavipes]|uniref:Uncharacterized protein n=1 Tax=Trichonephila clavipes TaxID=2585209 RepID=A0A8X7BL31_TRICX|nr:hypothetical protein TNCV_4842831 [Trichonephila clavipes]
MKQITLPKGIDVGKDLGTLGIKIWGIPENAWTFVTERSLHGRGGILNSHRASSPLVKFVEEKERWEALTT